MYQWLDGPNDVAVDRYGLHRVDQSLSRRNAASEFKQQQPGGSDMTRMVRLVVDSAFVNLNGTRRSLNPTIPPPWVDGNEYGPYKWSEQAPHLPVGQYECLLLSVARPCTTRPATSRSCSSSSPPGLMALRRFPGTDVMWSEQAPDSACRAVRDFDHLNGSKAVITPTGYEPVMFVFPMRRFSSITRVAETLSSSRNGDPREESARSFGMGGEETP